MTTERLLALLEAMRAVAPPEAVSNVIDGINRLKREMLAGDSDTLPSAWALRCARDALSAARGARQHAHPAHRARLDGMLEELETTLRRATAIARIESEDPT